jgi:hypothetical protein
VIYFGISIPVIGLGFAGWALGLVSGGLLFIAAVIVLLLVSLGWLARYQRRYRYA